MTTQVAGGRAGKRPLTRLERRTRRSRLALRGSFLIAAVALTGVISFIAGLLHAPVNFGLPPAPRPALLYADDGTQLAQIRPPTRRTPVKAEQIPAVMRNAIIAAEDERFLKHQGVDLKATLRAAVNDLTGGSRQGGSTLTQQYVKNVYVDDDQTLRRKVQEAGLAVRLEQKLDKQQIITNYLNVLYLGNGTYGVEAAAQYYFGVSIADLGKDNDPKTDPTIVALARASMLAGIAPAPSVYNPVKGPGLALKRQIYTLNRMKINGFITTEQASKALEIDVHPVKQVEKDKPSAAPEYTDALKAELKKQFGGEETVGGSTTSEQAFYGSGLRVKGTVNLRLQAALATAMKQVLPRPTDPQAAAVAVNYETGDVKAMSTIRRAPERQRTAIDPKTKKKVKLAPIPAVLSYTQGGTNLATSTFRSTGSTIKPFTLATALESGRHLDDGVSYSGCDTIAIKNAPDYRYCNSDGESSSSGSTTLAGALARSINTVYVPLAIEVGRAKVRALALKAGFRVCSPKRADGTANGACKVPFSPQPLSFGLGSTAEVTTLSLATAFSTLMNGGVRQEPRYFTEVRENGTATTPGTVIPGAGAKKPGVRAMPEAIADQVKEAMSKVATGAGTAPRAHQPWTVYGKTGTTNDSTDARFVGCGDTEAGKICLSVWMGNEYPSCRGIAKGDPCGGMLNLYGNKQVYGGTLPAEIFARTWALYRAGIAAAKAVDEGPLVTAAPTTSPTPIRSRVPSATPSATPTKAPTKAPATTPPVTTPRVTTAPPVTTPPATTEPPIPPLFGPATANARAPDR